MDKDIKERIAAINSGIIPEGYKKTKVGIVPVEWKVKKLGDFCEIIGGGTPSTKNKEYWNGDIPWISSSDLKEDDVYNINIDRYITTEAVEKSATNICPKNTIHLVSRVGVGKIAYSERCICTSQDFTNIIKYESDKMYLVYTLYFKMQKEINNTQGTSIKGITTSEIKQFLMNLPPLPEQQKIAEILSTQDKLIELQEKKIEQLKEMKKAYLQKMFPQKGSKYPELRFKGFTDPWEQRKFSDFAQRESAVEVSSPNCPCVEYEDVIAEEGRLNKDIKLKETQKTGIKFDGTQVLYGKLRPYLHNWLNPDFTGVAVGDWWVLRPICIDKDYLYHLIQTKQFDDVANQSAGSKMPRADWNLISNTEFFVPISMEEQSKIAQAFTNLDSLITLHQRKSEQEKQKKKALMQLLLTGIVRTK